MSKSSHKTSIEFELPSVSNSFTDNIQLSSGKNCCLIKHKVHKSGKLTDPVINLKLGGNLFYVLGEKDTLSVYNNNKYVGKRKIIGLNLNQVSEAISFKKSTGQLYLLTRGCDEAQLYTLDLSDNCTVKATPVGILATVTGSLVKLNGELNMSFNQVSGFLRVVTTTGQNLLVDPANARTIIEDNLTYTDAEASLIPKVEAIAYNSSGTLYGIDDLGKNLVTINPPEDGIVSTVGRIDVDFIKVNGFDIKDSTNIGYAVLTKCEYVGLYEINLETAAVLHLQKLHFKRKVVDFAIAPLAIAGSYNLQLSLFKNDIPIYVSKTITLSIFNPIFLTNKIICWSNECKPMCTGNLVDSCVKKCDVLTAKLEAIDNGFIPEFLSVKFNFEIESC